jgi:hypothetical protein
LEGGKLNRLFRREIFKAVAQSDLPGLIFTYMFNFDLPSEYEYINSVINRFKTNGADACVVELRADFDVRIERNKTENRLEHKASKRNIEWSESLLYGETKFRLNTHDGEEPFENYLKIDNTYIPPEKAAAIIKDTFKL